MCFLQQDLRHNAGADSPAAFADRETQAFFHRDRRDQFNFELQVVAGHHHLGAFWQNNSPGHIRRAEVELWAVVRKERCVTTALFLGQNIGFGFKLGVRLDRTGLAQNLPTLNTFTVNTAQQRTDVVASLAAVQQFAEHFHTGTDGLLGVADTDDFNLVAHVHHTAFHTTGHNRATARDREHVFDRHQERQVDRACRCRDVFVDSRDQRTDRAFTDFRLGAVHRMQRRAGDDGDIIAGIVVFGQKLADFHLDQFQQFGVIHLVDLVHVHDHVWNADLTAQQDVLAGLRHRAVSSVHNKDRAVHLGGTGDHVLHIVGVAGAIDVRIMARFGFVFHVRGRNRDPAGLFFGRAVDLVVGLEIAEILGDRRRQRRLAVVNVTDRADVHVRFGAFELCLCHGVAP
ncbi:ISxac3 transposase [Yoonia vestfoldensis SKA53]|uniref:ISxac3 transposase n=1 Tax=Yoonia vestfoldensis SKA53 TaxID=314232 RepID=A3V386_9RHOB|nr:ISxac3 transposase [Yoonia vestfoldensis SKA53]